MFVDLPQAKSDVEQSVNVIDGERKKVTGKSQAGDHCQEVTLTSNKAMCYVIKARSFLNV